MIKIFVALAYLTVPPVTGDLCTSDNPDFDGVRYEENIPHCYRNVSTGEKNAICERDGVFDRTGFTVDHIIPLSIGGSNSRKNLWCQNNSLSVTGLEAEMYKMVKAGDITQKEAIKRILKAKFGR